MIRKTVVAFALALSLAALAATLLARPSGAAHRRYTFAYVTNYHRQGERRSGGGQAARRPLHPRRPEQGRPAGSYRALQITDRQPCGRHRARGLRPCAEADLQRGPEGGDPPDLVR